MKKWTPYISLDCEGQIWNILPGFEDTILLEVRTKQSAIRYYEINLSTGESTGLPVSDVPWWSQVVFYSPGVLLVQEFDEEQNPDKVNLHFYRENILEWTRKETRFEGYQDNQLLLKNALGETERIVLGEFSHRTTFDFPWHYVEGEEYFREAAGFLQDREITPIRAIDYFECEEAVFMSYYQEFEGGLSLSLLGLNDVGETLLDETLEINLKGIADPSFLISKRNVIFVKEKRHFFVYRIAD